MPESASPDYGSQLSVILLVIIVVFTVRSKEKRRTFLYGFVGFLTVAIVSMIFGAVLLKGIANPQALGALIGRISVLVWALISIVHSGRTRRLPSASEPPKLASPPSPKQNAPSR
jgi:hypothetical protein